MLDINTIKTLYLTSEVIQPKNESEMFINSDKPWQDANLGKNSKSADVAFEAALKASEGEEA